MKKMISLLLVIALFMLPVSLADTELVNGVEMTIETQYFSAEQTAEGAIVVSTLVSTVISDPEVVTDIHYANGEMNISVTQNGSTYYINVYTYDDGSMQIDTLTPAAQSSSSWPSSGFSGLFGFGGASEIVTGRPSAEWLAMADNEIVSDICTLINDPSFIESLDLPDEVAYILDPAVKYTSEPVVVIYAPEDMTALASALYDTETVPAFLLSEHEIFSNLTTILISNLCGDKELALFGSINLNRCIPANAEYLPVISIYAPTDGSAASCIVVYHSSSDGITSMQAHVLSYHIAAELMDPASELSSGLAQCGVEIKRTGDDYPEFPAAFEAPAGTVIADADDEWLGAAALDIAADVIALSGDYDAISLYTTEPEILDICLTVGSLPIQFGEIVSVERYDASTFNALLGDAPIGVSSDIVMKYYGPLSGGLMAQAQRNMYGTYVISAGVRCTASDVFYANADFISCNVTVSFGCNWNIVVSFANHGNGIISATGSIMPAE